MTQVSSEMPAACSVNWKEGQPLSKVNSTDVELEMVKIKPMALTAVVTVARTSQWMTLLTWAKYATTVPRTSRTETTTCANGTPNHRHNQVIDQANSIRAGRRFQRTNRTRNFGVAGWAVQQKAKSDNNLLSIALFGQGIFRTQAN